MRTQAERAATFQALHERPGAFIIPNPWEAGTARLLASLGFVRGRSYPFTLPIWYLRLLSHESAKSILTS